MKRMPVLFVGHGSPMNIIEENPFTQGWARIAQEIPRPRAILCISAHWYTDGDGVLKTAQPETIHDFYGFPRALYEVKYPAPGDPVLAMEVAGLFGGEAFVDTERGLDHGVWSVLHFMYPQADIPVLQLTVNAALSPQESYLTGQRLKALRDEGVLILGSGNVVHNLGRIAWDQPGGFPWADAFDAYIKEAVLAGRHEDVVHYQNAGPAAHSAFVTRDHFDPLLYALGATDQGESIRVFNDARIMGSLSMTSYLFEAD